MGRVLLRRLALAISLVACGAQAELVGYWTFDGTCEDRTGHGHDGTLVGGSYSSDVPAVLSGQSLDLTAGNHYVIIDSLAFGDAADPFNFGSGFTVSCWVKGWPGDWEPFVSKNGENGLGWQLRKYSTGSKLGWTTRGTGTDDLQGTADANGAGWHHIAATYDGVFKRIYLDGVLDRSIESTGTVTPCPYRVVFGAREQSSEGNITGHAQVMMDDVAIFDTTLGLSGIRALAQGTSPAAVDAVNPLIGYWTFDADSIADSSGCGFDGTLYGGTYSTDVPTALGGGKSLDLRGGDYYARIDAIVNNPTADPFDLPQVTVSVWVKGWPDADNDAFVNKRADGYGWSVRREGSTVEFGTWDETPNELSGGTTAVTDGNWHHICCTSDGTRKRIFVDGRLDMSAAGSGPRDHGNERLCFGAREYGNDVRDLYSSVQLDDIAIFDRALAPNQVRYLAQGGAATALPAAGGETVFDFEDGTLQGWRNVLVSRLVKTGTDGFPADQTIEFVASNKVNTSHGSYKLEQERSDPTFTELDGRHATHLVRSPRFLLDGSGDLSLWLMGGVGPAVTATDDTIHLGLADGTLGTMRAYLRRCSDGQYLFNMRRTTSANTFEQHTLTSAQLAPYVSATETYTVDIVDSCYGGWGWIAVDDVAIPGVLSPEPYCKAIQFDMSQQRGTYLGSDSPAHLLGKIPTAEKYWNGAGVDVAAGKLFWSNGGDAPNVAIDFGGTTDAAGVGDIDWNQVPGCATTDLGSGVYNNYLMRDWAVADNNNNLGARVTGLPEGLYQVFALVREPNQPGRTYDVYFGRNISNTSAPGAIKRSIAATGASAWTDGQNYVQAVINITSESDALTVIVDPTNAAWPTLEGLQIVNITQVGAVFTIR